MSDLVDYLRDKLEHADDVVGTCPDCDISTPGHPGTVQGWSVRCPIHGIGGTEPLYPDVPIEPDPDLWAWTEPAPRRWWRR